MKIRIEAEPINAREALSVALDFGVAYRERVGSRRGVIYSRGGLAFYAYRTPGGCIVVIEDGAS